MLKIYRAGPLRASTEFAVRQNRANARTHAELLWELGFSVFCPHLNTDGMIGRLEDENRFIDGALLWLAHADIVVALPGWRQSKGAKTEVNLATSLNLPVLHLLGSTSIIIWWDKDRDKILSRQQLLELSTGNITLPNYERRQE